MFLYWYAWVGTSHDLYAGEGEEEGYFHVLHGEGMIAVLSLYLLADDICDEFELGCGAVIPAAREGEVYLCGHSCDVIWYKDIAFGGDDTDMEEVRAEA